MATRTALFGRPQQAQARHLLQFKAGKMTLDDNNLVQPDPRKGWVYVYQAGDGKLHFCWIDRKTYLVEEEPNSKNDNDICSRVNDYIMSPPAQSSSTMGVGLSGGLNSDSDISSAYATVSTIGRHLHTSHVEDTNPISHFGNSSIVSNSGATATRPTPNEKRTERGKIQLQDLRNILSSVNTTGIDGLNKSSEARIEFGDVLNVENLLNLLEKPEIQARLVPLLPATDPEVPCANDLDNLTVNIQSSQFKSTLKSFSAAFRTGDLAPVLAQFNLGPKADDTARKGDLIGFSHALESTTNVSSGSNTISVNPFHTDDDENKSDKKLRKVNKKDKESQDTALVEDNNNKGSSSSNDQTDDDKQTESYSHSKMDIDD